MADSASSNPSGEQPKIIIDSDWKAQAQKEKEHLAAKEKEAQAKAGATAAGPGAPAAAGTGAAGGPAGLPDADFQGVVGILVTQALMYMGGFPDPETGRALVSLEHAKFHIDALAVLETKTKGNLTQEEASDLTMALSELRMRFVEIAKAIAQASKEGRVAKGGAGGGMMGGGPGGMGGFGGGGTTFTAGPGGMTKM